MIATDWKDIRSDKFSIFKPQRSSGDGYKILFKYDNIPLVVQTPKVVIYNYPKQFNNTIKLSISFYDYNTNENTFNFVNKIMSIEKFVKKSKSQLKKFIDSTFNKTKFKSCLKKSLNETTVYMELNINPSIISVFNLYKEPQTTEYIVPYSYLLNIIHMEYIWMTRNNFGIKWSLVQTKVLPPINKLDKCIIEDIYDDEPHKHYFDVKDTKKQDINKESNPIFGKYLKMKRMKIPVDRIYLKIRLDGLNVTDFEDFDAGKIVKSSPNITLKNNLLNIKNQLTITQKKKKTVTSTPFNTFAPSINQLNDIRMSLKKTHVDRL